MKIRPFSSWLSLAPEWLLAIGNNGQRQSYRISIRWDGRRTLAAAQAPTGKPCYLVLDPGCPYRRKLLRLPDSEKGRQALLRAAPEEFPLIPETLEFGLGLRDGEGYLYALPVGKREQLASEGINPVIVLISNGAVTEASCLEAIEQYERHGRSLAIGSLRTRYVSRSLLRSAALGTGLCLSTMLAVILIAAPGIFGDLVAWRTDQLRREAGDLPEVFRASENMLATQADAAKLLRSSEARLPQVLAQLFATVPPRHGIRRIEFDGKELVVAGTGTDVQQWLGQAGFESSQISVESTGTFQRFRAVRNLTTP